MAQALKARATDWSQKNETGSITYGTDREDEVSKIVDKTLGLKRGGRFKFKKYFEFRERYSD